MLSTNVILLAIVMIGLIYLYCNINFREGGVGTFIESFIPGSGGSDRTCPFFLPAAAGSFMLPGAAGTGVPIPCPCPAPCGPGTTGWTYINSIPGPPRAFAQVGALTTTDADLSVGYANDDPPGAGTSIIVTGGRNVIPTGTPGVLPSDPGDVKTLTTTIFSNTYVLPLPSPADSQHQRDISRNVQHEGDGTGAGVCLTTTYPLNKPPPLQCIKWIYGWSKGPDRAGDPICAAKWARQAGVAFNGKASGGDVLFLIGGSGTQAVSMEQTNQDSEYKVVKGCVDMTNSSWLEKNPGSGPMGIKKLQPYIYTAYASTPSAVGETKTQGAPYSDFRTD